MNDTLITLGISTASAVFVLLTLYWFVTIIMSSIGFP